MTNAPSSNDFERLLQAMPAMADAVNAFSSEDVQRAAFDALVSAIGIKPTVPDVNPPGAADVGSEAAITEKPEVAKRAKTAAGSRSRSTTKRTYSVARGLNFAPDGAPSLAQFVKEKAPVNQDERNLVACYYISEHMSETVDLSKVLAVYQASDWPAPSHPNTSLQKTASAKGWIDTANMDDIKVVWAGTNHVAKLPSKTQKP